MSRLTDYGFTFGPVEVTRMVELPNGSVVLRLETKAGLRTDVYISPKGARMSAYSGIGDPVRIGAKP